MGRLNKISDSSSKPGSQRRSFQFKIRLFCVILATFTVSVAPIPAKETSRRPSPGVLTTASQIRAMSIEQAKQGRQFHQPASAYWFAVPLGNEFYSGGECPRCSRRTSPSRRARFPAILSDGHMPNVDGFALAEQIQKQSNPNARRGDDAHLRRSPRGWRPLPCVGNFRVPCEAHTPARIAKRDMSGTRCRPSSAKHSLSHAPRETIFPDIVGRR